MASKEDFKIPVLSKSTYQRWSFEVKAGLKSVGVFKVVDGTDKCPSSPPDEVSEWEKRDAKAMRIITVALNDDDHAAIRDCDTAAAIWKKITSMYETKTEANKYLLNQALHTLKFRDHHSISSYCAELSVLRQKLITAGDTVSEAALVAKLINDLPSRFESFLKLTTFKPPRTKR